MRLALLATALALAGCVSPAYLPETAGMASVSVDCGDGYQVRVGGGGPGTALVIPYPASEARYAICAGSAARPLEERARLALVQHMRKAAKQECRATGSTSAGYRAYRVTYADCRPLPPA